LVNERNREEFDEVSNRRLTSMALDIASGLAYLSEKRYVHRDIACRNCLVNSDRVVKLADFGMTRPMAETEYYRFSRKGKQIVQFQNEAYLPHQLINRNAASEMDVA
jgi:serine/threonine protein kinase